MKGYLLILIGILISMVSCKPKGNQKIEISIQKPTTELNVETEKQIEEINITEQFIENDSLIIVFKSELKKIALNPKFGIEKKQIKNRHVDNLIDTIITQNFDKTKIYSYKASSEEWIYSAKIENSEFEFLDSIKVGMNKKTLEDILKMELESDLIKIGNLEQTSVFIFKFENEMLKAIDYEGYVD